MHTILEARPAVLAAVAAAVKTTEAPSETASSEASTLVDVPRPDIAGAQTKAVGRSIPAIAQAFPGMQPFVGTPRPSEPTPGVGTRAPREVTMVPIIPPQRKSRSLWPLVTILVLCILGWGLMQWRDARARAYRPAVTDASPMDPEYFDIRVAQIVEDCQSQLREVKDPATTQKVQEALWDRVRRLRTKLVSSTLSEERKAGVGQALDEIVTFLKDDVGAALAVEKSAAPATVVAATAPATPGTTTVAAAAPAKPKRISRAALDRAADLLAHLPP